MANGNYSKDSNTFEMLKLEHSVLRDEIKTNQKYNAIFTGTSGITAFAGFFHIISAEELSPISFVLAPALILFSMTVFTLNVIAIRTCATYIREHIEKQISIKCVAIDYKGWETWLDETVKGIPFLHYIVYMLMYTIAFWIVAYASSERLQEQNLSCFGMDSLCCYTFAYIITVFLCAFLMWCRAKALENTSSDKQGKNSAN